jgi:uncharacterized membrane protein YfcA
MVIFMTISLKDHFARAQRYTSASVVTAFSGGLLGSHAISADWPALGVGLIVTAVAAGVCFGKKADKIKDEAIAQFQPGPK